MRRISKHSFNLRGFTLVEILIVVGIIVILAGVVALGVNDMIDPARRVQSSVRQKTAQQSVSISVSESTLKSMGF